jgi:gamma-glutamylcyclotransferase (GGCT)/AIG2-like uncharacterized protein YtfP
MQKIEFRQPSEKGNRFFDLRSFNIFVQITQPSYNSPSTIPLNVLPSNSEMTECNVSLTLLLALCPVATTMEKRPSLMVRKFLQFQTHGRAWEADPNFDYSAFRRKFYFFYGSLMDPSTLAHVLGLRDQPQLLPSKIIGYSYMLWGQYPALLDGPPNAVVYGMAYDVQTQSEEERLEFYETSHYKASHCLIELQDGRKVIGKTFLWNADMALLKEGTFDLKDWQMDKLDSD